MEHFIKKHISRSNPKDILLNKYPGDNFNQANLETLSPYLHPQSYQDTGKFNWDPREPGKLVTNL